MLLIEPLRHRVRRDVTGAPCFDADPKRRVGQRRVDVADAVRIVGFAVLGGCLGIVLGGLIGFGVARSVIGSVVSVVGTGVAVIGSVVSVVAIGVVVARTAVVGARVGVLIGARLAVVRLAGFTGLGVVFLAAARAAEACRRADVHPTAGGSATAYSTDDSETRASTNVPAPPVAAGRHVFVHLRVEYGDARGVGHLMARLVEPTSVTAVVEGEPIALAAHLDVGVYRARLGSEVDLDGLGGVGLRSARGSSASAAPAAGASTGPGAPGSAAWSPGSGASSPGCASSPGSPARSLAPGACSRHADLRPLVRLRGRVCQGGALQIGELGCLVGKNSFGSTNESVTPASFRKF